jgi:hypothetical protein
MINKELNIYCACISTNRPSNVKKLENITGLKFTYYTKPNETNEYRKQGATNVVEVDGNICKARNIAIKDAHGMICLQISDDYQYCNLITGEKNNYIRKKIDFIKALKFMLDKFRKVEKCLLAGTSITDSIIHYAGKPISLNKLVVNDCILIKQGIEYDERADLKEDYDMFVTQVRSNNLVMRFDCLQMKFPHRNNKGGANDYRTKEREIKCNRYVMMKHQGIIELHKTRVNQIQINMKKLYEKN